ncbi:MAG: type VI secretion system baseplate subunit TssK [Burkholderiaceae bacterium]
MSREEKVIWSEGMFLQPQHFQQHDRYLERLLESRVAPSAPYSWGYVRLLVDDTMLALGKLSILSAAGVFPDGTPFDFPMSQVGPHPLDVPSNAKDQVIFLAVPLRQAGVSENQFTSQDEAGLARYAVTERDIADDAAASSARVQVGQLQMRLLLESEKTDAYACLGVVRLIEKRADNTVILDKQYIAPTLRVSENGQLAGYVRDVTGMLHQRGEELAAQVTQPGRGGVGEIADFLLLQTVNRYEPVFVSYTRNRMLHPERLFGQCLELAGDLSTFSRESRRVPSYPEYMHDSLEKCFVPLIADLRRSLSMVLHRSAVQIELQDRKFGVRVAVIADHDLLKTASFVLAVSAQLSSEVLRTRFPSQVKIGPVERIRDLVNLQLPGIPLRSMPIAPRQIPFHAGFNYFELERGGELWGQLEKSGGMALHIAGEFPGIELEFWGIKG